MRTGCAFQGVQGFVHGQLADLDKRHELVAGCFVNVQVLMPERVLALLAAAARVVPPAGANTKKK